jgi:hypothetical protein
MIFRIIDCCGNIVKHVVYTPNKRSAPQWALDDLAQGYVSHPIEQRVFAKAKIRQAVCSGCGDSRYRAVLERRIDR